MVDANQTLREYATTNALVKKPEIDSCRIIFRNGGGRGRSFDPSFANSRHTETASGGPMRLAKENRISTGKRRDEPQPVLSRSINVLLSPRSFAPRGDCCENNFMQHQRQRQLVRRNFAVRTNPSILKIMHRFFGLHTIFVESEGRFYVQPARGPDRQIY